MAQDAISGRKEAPPAASTLPEVVTGTLPPDPSLAGLWWLRYDDGRIVRWCVMHWDPQYALWFHAGDCMHPSSAAYLGWRCVAPAIPPDDAA